MSSTEVGHFAKTKHARLPAHVKAAGKGFFHLMRAVQKGEKPLTSVNESVSDSAKRHIPKDATEVKESTTPDSNVTFTPQAAPPMEVSAKLSNLTKLAISSFSFKAANIHSILARGNKAIQDVTSARREVVSSQLDQLRKHNEKLTKENEGAKLKLMKAEQKAYEASIQAAQSNLTVEQMQALQQQQRTPPPPEQPPYGAQLIGGTPGRTASMVNQPVEK